MALIATPTENVVSASNNPLEEPPAGNKALLFQKKIPVLGLSMSWLIFFRRNLLREMQKKSALPKDFHVASSCHNIERRHAGYIFLVWHTDVLQELKDRHTIDNTGSHMQDV